MPAGLRRLASVRRAPVALILLSAAFVPAQNTIGFLSRVAPNGDGEAVLSNQSNSPVVAWIFEILREPCNPVEAGRHTYIGYDSASAQDAAGVVGPHAARVQDIGVSRCNKDGVNSPNRASLKVALFAGGASFGDPRWLATLLRDRRLRLRRIDDAIQTLRGIGRNRTIPECLALLEKARAALPRPAEPLVEYSAIDPFDFAIRQLGNHPSEPLDKQLAGLLDTLGAERSRLQKRG